MIWATKMKSLFDRDKGPSRAVVEASVTGRSVGLSMNMPSDSFGCLTNADGGMVDDGAFKMASSSSMRSCHSVNSANHRIQPKSVSHLKTTTHSRGRVVFNSHITPRRGSNRCYITILQRSYSLVEKHALNRRRCQRK